MSLMVGTGPFGHRPAGRFNFDVPREGVELIEPFPRRIRALAGGEVVVDCSAARMLHEQGSLPVWCFPPEDVDLDRLGDGARIHDDGLAAGLVTVSWDAVEKWLEEEEEVIVHPRDPYHRLELRDSSRLVEVTLDGELLARSSQPLALFEATLPPRWYLPREDVHAALEPNPDVRTGCAYKGWAHYDDLQVGDRREPFLAWHYPEPLRGMERIRDRIAFFNERVDLRLDGEPQERPRTQWSGTDWARGS